MMPDNFFNSFGLKLSRLGNLTLPPPAPAGPLSALGAMNPPPAPSREMTLSSLQINSRPADFAGVIDNATRRSDAAIADVWKSYAGPGTRPATVEDQQAIFRDLPNVRPMGHARLAELGQVGRASVVDPEGRRGAPLFVAGTAPDGRNVPLDAGSIARMADALSYVHKMDRPGAPWGGRTFRGGPDGGEAAMLLNTAANEMRTPPADVLTHELGHVAHNRMGISDNPLAGASPEAMREFSAMAGARGAEPGAGRTLKDYQYFNSGREQFAEAFRSYVTNPNDFKARFPAAAAFMRRAVNENPNMRDVLFLSQTDGGNAVG